MNHDGPPDTAVPVEAYTVGWICALQEEYESACRMLDEEMSPPDTVDDSDDSTYAFGRIGAHYVVIGCLPAGRYGTSSAACVARDMTRSFSGLRFALMVGIGGGLPTANRDIRLGDVVVSMPQGGFGGVIQYDLGKRLSNGRFEQTGQLNAPPDRLLRAIPELRRCYSDPRKPDRIAEHIRRMDDMTDYQRPTSDKLYRSVYVHRVGDSCDSYDDDELVSRGIRDGPRAVAIHYGTIASGSSVIKDATLRDDVATWEYAPLCFEMEAAGLMNTLPSLVIRGICDYSDSHKNDTWHKYASLTAAAYARELLLVLKGKKLSTRLLRADEPETGKWKMEQSSLIFNAYAPGPQASADTLFFADRLDPVPDDRLHDWLSPVDSSANLHAAIDALEPGTGTWLLHDPKYKRWKDTPASPILLQGIPGSGKTVLTSMVIDDCEQSVIYPTTSNVLLYFYFDFSDSNNRTHDAMIRSIIWQLSAQNKRGKFLLRELFKSCHNGQQQPAPKQLYDVFGKMVSDLGHVYVVIDAVDECPDRDEIIWLLKRFTTWYKNLHLFVSSRPDGNVEEKLLKSFGESALVPMVRDNVNDDIRRFVQRTLQTDEALQKWNKLPYIQGEIESTIMSQADGMFQLAVCQLDSVRQSVDCSMLRNVLATLPITLEETYLMILQRINGLHREYALKILQWLVYATQPLAVEQMIDAIAVQLDAQSFDPQNRLLNANDIKLICSSLVTIEERPDDVRLVKLSHSSVRDFLVSDEAQKFFNTEMQEAAANTAISSICLKYILQLDVDCFSDPDMLRKFPLTTYAVGQWPYHARKGMEGSEVLLGLIRELFLENRQSYCVWACLYEGYSPPFDHGEASLLCGQHPLIYACITGLAKSVKMILDRGESPDTWGVNGTALQTASHYGWTEIVGHLLDRGANPDVCENEKGTALRIATHEGHAQTVRRLLEAGADPNLTYQLSAIRQSESPLQEALCSVRQDIALLLIAHGADPNCPCGEYGSPLQLALELQMDDVTEALLDKDADPNVCSGSHNTTLQIASRNGHEKMVEFLLEKGADPNLHNGQAESPLQQALYRSHPRIVAMLLDKGAYPDSEICGRALELAAYDGRLDMVRVLVHKAMVANAPGDSYGVALWMASSEGHEEVVRMLLENRDRVSSEFMSLAREWAGTRKHDDIVRMLGVMRGGRPVPHNMMARREAWVQAGWNVLT